MRGMRRCGCWLLLAVVAAGGDIIPARAAEIIVQQADTELIDGVYHVNADLDFELSRQAAEALDNGVPLTLVLDIEVVRPRDWLWDEGVTSLRQRYRLSYQALSDRYTVYNLNSGAETTYATQGMALAAIGHVRDLPVLDRQLLDTGRAYEFRLRGRLDMEALPVPLRLTAYLSPGWYLASDWHTWPLQ